MKPMALALFLAMAAMTFSCTKKEATAVAEAEEDTAGKGPLVRKFRIGSAVDGDGVVTRETDAFQQGEGIHISFVLKNVPKDTPIRVVWRDAANQQVAEEQKPLPADGVASFTLKDAATVAPGDYIVEFTRAESTATGGWAPLGTKTFKVGPKIAP